MATTLTLAAPADYLFRRDVCSYGYFLLMPNQWDPAARTLTRWLDLADGSARVTLAQPGDAAGLPVKAKFDRALSRTEQAQAKRMIARMLRLDETESATARFHAIDPRWKVSGRARLFRSPTFFEDLIKTVTNCNVQWSGTIRMNERLCAVINPAFPKPSQLARRKPESLRTRCGLGYRDQRIVELGRIVAAGELDIERLEDPATPDEDVERTLVALPGIGPYAAANIMQLLGRYSRLALDTETMRHGKAVLGMTEEGKALERRLHKHYQAFGDQRFRSYWFELWDFYEQVKGPAWDWEPRTTGATFTKAQLEPRKPQTLRPGTPSPR